MMMKLKIFSMILVCLVMLVMIAPIVALAATTATVTITATPTYIAIDNTPSSYGFGAIAVSATPSTTAGYFTIGNSSTTSTNVSIWGTDFTGGSTWTLNTLGSPGSFIVGMYAGVISGSFNIVVTTSPGNVLKSSLAASTTQTWHLKLMCPTNFGTTDNAAHSSTITISAAAA